MRNKVYFVISFYYKKVLEEKLKMPRSTIIREALLLYYIYCYKRYKKKSEIDDYPSLIYIRLNVKKFHYAIIYIVAKLNRVNVKLDIDGIKFRTGNKEKAKNKIMKTIIKISTTTAPLKVSAKDVIMKFDDRTYAKALSLALELTKFSNSPRYTAALAAYLVYNLVYNVKATLTNRQTISFSALGVKMRFFIECC